MTGYGNPPLLRRIRISSGIGIDLIQLVVVRASPACIGSFIRYLCFCFMDFLGRKHCILLCEHLTGRKFLPASLCLHTHKSLYLDHKYIRH